MVRVKVSIVSSVGVSSVSERVKRVKCVKCVESRVLIMTRTEGEAECQVAAGSLGGSCCQASDRLMGELMGLGDGCR